MASPAGYKKIANFNLAGLAPSVDFFNLMSYDFHGTWENTTGHQSAFTGDANGYDVETAVNLYLANGVDPGKIVLGAPLYTRGWSGVADGGDGGYLETTSGKAPGSFGPASMTTRTCSPNCRIRLAAGSCTGTTTRKRPYLYNAQNQLFSSFETPTSIAQKSQWAEDLGLGGMMFWDITNDATGSSENLVNAAFLSWVLGQELETIRANSTLTGEQIIGGDGVITVIPTEATSINL